MCIFFFKQKTAYEMRISDWSSDVCSSDLLETPIVAFRTRFLEERRHRNCKTVAAGAARVLARDTIEPTFPAAREREVRRIDRKTAAQIGRASCRERECQYRVDLGGRRIITNHKNITNTQHER